MRRQIKLPRVESERAGRTTEECNRSSAFELSIVAGGDEKLVLWIWKIRGNSRGPGFFKEDFRMRKYIFLAKKQMRMNRNFRIRPYQINVWLVMFVCAHGWISQLDAKQLTGRYYHRDLAYYHFGLLRVTFQHVGTVWVKVHYSLQ